MFLLKCILPVAFFTSFLEGLDIGKQKEKPRTKKLDRSHYSQVYLIYVGRLLCGLSLGAVTVAVPLYNYDVAPDVCRGRGGVFLDFMLCAGILYSYVASSVMGLRMFSFTCSLIPVAFFAVFYFMPESPKYLYSKGRYVDAKMVLMYVYTSVDYYYEIPRVILSTIDIVQMTRYQWQRGRFSFRKQNNLKGSPNPQHSLTKL